MGDLVQELARLAIDTTRQPHDLRLHAQLSQQLVDLRQLPRKALTQPAARNRANGYDFIALPAKISAPTTP